MEVVSSESSCWVFCSSEIIGSRIFLDGIVGTSEVSRVVSERGDESDGTGVTNAG